MPTDEREPNLDPAPAHQPVQRRTERFDPATLDKTLIALPLLDEMAKLQDDAPWIDIIIDVNLEYPGGRAAARGHIKELVGRVAQGRRRAIHEANTRFSQQYIFASLTRNEIRELARLDLAEHPGGDIARGAAPCRAIYKLWLDHDAGVLTNKSISTVKADAARNAFSAFGSDIVWAVLDTGVDGNHPHFAKHMTLTLQAPLAHRDFTSADDSQTIGERESALLDRAGHGTHVAGIIAGEFQAGPVIRIVDESPVAESNRIASTIGQYDEDGANRSVVDVRQAGAMSGMAPQTKILSLKVLDDQGAGKASSIIAALEYIQDLNSYGRRILVHGVNLSVGYGFEPAWFACGQSPLCVEVNRLVRSGVVVVVAAGNTGYGYNQPASRGPKAAGLDITINDPGNADLAITVGSTHREMPHIYGVSYFSSKGPTGDGRLKPDLVAPGEKIISCASGDAAGMEPRDKDGVVSRYKEDSGTSMAAPHVSGVIAAFLSIRREFIGQPERVKEIFLATATDLGRAVYFQGRGLVDLMRAIQSV